MGLGRGFAAGFAAGTSIGNQLAGIWRDGQIRSDLEKAGAVTPETVDSQKAVETTQGTEGMVQDSETGNYVPKMFDQNGNLTESGLSRVNATEPEPTKIVEPTFKTETTRKYKLGNQEQDTPFTQEQSSPLLPMLSPADHSQALRYRRPYQRRAFSDRMRHVRLC